jgi:hypothetical protein
VERLRSTKAATSAHVNDDVDALRETNADAGARSVPIVI